MYSFLRGEMIKANITITSLAQKIGVTEKTMRNKINGDTDFTWTEALKVRDIVNPSLKMEKLFQADEPISGKEVV